MNERTLISDIGEAASLIETYQLAALVWTFEECPLNEIKHYVPRGKEELVVVAHKNNKYISYRLIFDPDFRHIDYESYRITLDFHPDYYIHIILNTDDEEE